jgi:flagellar hook-basal body complex protein FliE
MLPILSAVSAAAVPLPLNPSASLASGATSSVPGSSTIESTPFSGLITDAVGQVNQLEDGARAAMTGLITGTGVDVHQAMIATEKASMAFELALAVRNKAVQAYQQVMSMQF